jgi:tripartite-type tricarboxylate transporter receptor subunit TctC
MTFHRRQFLQMAVGTAALPTISRFAWAQSYPTRPVRLVVGYPAGGTTDILARLMGQWLSERLGQQFVIENRPGAAGNIAAEAVARAAPDGYTLLMIDPQPAINVTLFDKLNFDFDRDLAPVAGITRMPAVMVVNPSVPAKSVPEFMAYAKVNPGKLNFASPGIGTAPHLAGEMFKAMTGIDMVHVPYRGAAPALTDLLGGQVQVYFIATLASIDYIRDGRLRALGVTTSTRSDLLPDLPTLADFAPGYEMSAWFGIVAPKNTPAEIVDTLNKEINAGLADPKIKARLAGFDGRVLAGSPADFGKLIANETAKWGRVIRAAKVRLSKRPRLEFG